MELYARVRRAVVVDKMSEREAARQFGLARETVRKMLRYSVPPGYRRQHPARRPKLDARVGVIDQILEHGKAESKKQRHSAKRIFERLHSKLAHFVPGFWNCGIELLSHWPKRKPLPRMTRAIGHKKANYQPFDHNQLGRRDARRLQRACTLNYRCRSGRR